MNFFANPVPVTRKTTLHVGWERCACPEVTHLATCWWTLALYWWSVGKLSSMACFFTDTLEWSWRVMLQVHKRLETVTQHSDCFSARCSLPGVYGKVLYSFASAWRRAWRLLHSSGCHLAVCQPPAVPPEQTQRARSPAAVLGSYLARRFSTTHLCCPVFT